MSTVIAGVSRVNVPELSEEGESFINDLLEQAMVKRWGGTWYVIPGGDAHLTWNVLVHGNGVGLPTDEQVEFSEQVLESIWQDELPPGCWVDEEDAL